MATRISTFFGKRVAVSLAIFAALLVGVWAVGARAGGTAVVAPAQAQVMVHYGDLDLSTPEGVNILRRRIDSAARTVCSGDAQWRDLGWELQYRGCIRTATDKALDKVQLALDQVQWEVR
jgi:UrcA family protein